MVELGSLAILCGTFKNGSAASNTMHGTLTFCSLATVTRCFAVAFCQLAQSWASQAVYLVLVDIRQQCLPQRLAGGALLVRVEMTLRYSMLVFLETLH